MTRARSSQTGCLLLHSSSISSPTLFLSLLAPRRSNDGRTGGTIHTAATVSRLERYRDIAEKTNGERGANAYANGCLVQNLLLVLVTS